MIDTGVGKLCDRIHSRHLYVTSVREEWEALWSDAKRQDLILASGDWNLLGGYSSPDRAQLQRNVRVRLVTGLDLNRRPLGYECRQIFLSC